MKNRFLNSSFINRLLILLDAAALVLSLYIVFYFRIGGFLNYSLEIAVLVGLVLLNMYLVGSYSVQFRVALWREMGKYLTGNILSIFTVTAFIYFTREEIAGVFGRGVFIGYILLFFVAGFLYRYLLFYWLKKNVDKLRWLIIGNKKYIKHLVEDTTQLGVNGSIFYLCDEDLTDLNIDRRNILGNFKDLLSVADKNWSGIVLATDESEVVQISSDLMKLRFDGLQIYNLISFYESIWFKVPIYYLNSTWFALSEGFGLVHSAIGLRIKRILDISLSLILLLINLPILFILSVLIRLTSKGPAIYKQSRTGQGGKEFTIFKLRTMEASQNNEQTWVSENEKRITSLGKFLRLTRLDEIPQVINVLKGDMSFIGPRPEQPGIDKKLKQEIPFYSLRYTLKPGITGWAQVKYKYGASVLDSKEKLQFDLYYIKNYSLLLDLNIFLKTIRVVLGAKGR